MWHLLKTYVFYLSHLPYKENSLICFCFIALPSTTKNFLKFHKTLSTSIFAIQTFQILPLPYNFPAHISHKQKKNLRSNYTCTRGHVGSQLTEGPPRPHYLLSFSLSLSLAFSGRYRGATRARVSPNMKFGSSGYAARPSCTLHQRFSPAFVYNYIYSKRELNRNSRRRLCVATHM